MTRPPPGHHQRASTFHERRPEAAHRVVGKRGRLNRIRWFCPGCLGADITAGDVHLRQSASRRLLDLQRDGAWPILGSPPCLHQGSRRPLVGRHFCEPEERCNLRLHHLYITAQLVQVDSIGPTTREHVWAARREVSSLHRLHVAAKQQTNWRVSGSGQIRRTYSGTRSCTSWRTPPRTGR
jgi:hypothetical protein